MLLGHHSEREQAEGAGIPPALGAEPLSLTLVGCPQCLRGSLFMGEGSGSKGGGWPHISPTRSLGVASGGEVEPRDNAMCPASISLLHQDVQRLASLQRW